MLKRKDKFFLIGISLPILIITGLITISIFLPSQIDNSKNYERHYTPPSKPQEPPLDTCGNGVCEEYELIANCEKDCKGLETHTYGFCRSASWSGVYRVKLLGTDTYLDKSEMLGPDFKPNSECGKSIGISDCYYIYSITEVHEPIFEIQIYNAVTCNLNICDAINLKYAIDDEIEPCSDNKWERFGCNIYYPYDKERFDLFERVKID